MARLEGAGRQLDDNPFRGEYGAPCVLTRRRPTGFVDCLSGVSLLLDAVSSCVSHLYDGRCTESATFQLRLLEFHDGSPHPLALQPSIDIALPTKETHYIGHRVYMSMMGSYIIIAAGLPPERTGIDVLLLVDWQTGHVTTVSKHEYLFDNPADVSPKLCSTGPRAYLTDFLVLSENVLALIRGSENAIELCRIDTASTASLQTFAFWNSLLSYHTRDSALLP